METKSYSHLKSGTDVRGVAIATAGRELTLTIDAIDDICNAFLCWLEKKTEKSDLKVAIGYDCRLSSEAIYREVTNVLSSHGCNVVGCGLSSTPSMFILLKESGRGCDASIMITASHLPYYMNGLKFMTDEGGLEGDDIAEILAMAAKGERRPLGLGEVTYSSYMDKYCEKLVDAVRCGTGERAPLFGHIVIVDAGNGCGGFFVKKVLEPLGAICSGSVNLEPDGHFPAHIPNPESPDAMKALKKAVLSSGAELGITFDTDVDRAAIVDGDGKEINRDRLIALVSYPLLKERAGTIVTDSVTSDGLTEFIQRLHSRHVRYKRGYKNVIDEAKRRGAAFEYCPLAIETSGHAAFMDNYFLDDGAYLICKILISFTEQAKKGEKLSAIIANLKEPAEEKEIRLTFNHNSRDFKSEGARVIEEIKFYAEKEKGVSLAPENYEGVRLNFADGYGDGWSLVRMSVHDPVIPINFASRKKGGTRKMARYLYILLEKYPFIDVTPLKDYAGR